MIRIKRKIKTYLAVFLIIFACAQKKQIFWHVAFVFLEFCFSFCWFGLHFLEKLFNILFLNKTKISWRLPFQFLS